MDASIDSCSSAKKMNNGKCKNSKALASDALLLPVGLTNRVFFFLFFAATYFLLSRWRGKISTLTLIHGTSTPIHGLSFEDLVAIFIQFASFIYLVGFFGIEYVQNFISGNNDDGDVREEEKLMSPVAKEEVAVKRSPPKALLKGIALGDNEDDDIVAAVCNGTMASHSLESTLGDCKR